MQTRRSAMRNRTCLQAAACGLALFGLLVGCSEEKKEGEHKNVVERASDKVAQEAVEQIQRPLNKAEDSQALQNAQNQRLKDLVEQDEAPPKN